MDARLVGTCLVAWICILHQVPDIFAQQYIGGPPTGAFPQASGIPPYGPVSPYGPAISHGPPGVPYNMSQGPYASGSSRIATNMRLQPMPSNRVGNAGNRGFADSGVQETENFIVSCSDARLAQEVAEAAEEFRASLAEHWLGRRLPRWQDKCPIVVQASPRLQASGETSYMPINGTIVNWKMIVRGTRERVLDSVLPHEITHTILATHFARLNRPVPRWADEGAASTVEHASERRKLDQQLIRFIANEQAFSFARLFTMEEYPPGELMIALYAEGYSLASFLISQGGPQNFVAFLEKGIGTNNWVAACKDHYGYPTVGKLQTAWNTWVIDGGRDVSPYTAIALGYVDAPVRTASSEGSPFRARTPNPTGSLASSSVVPAGEFPAGDFPSETIQQAVAFQQTVASPQPGSQATTGVRDPLRSIAQDGKLASNETPYRPGSIKRLDANWNAVALQRADPPSLSAWQSNSANPNSANLGFINQRDQRGNGNSLPRNSAATSLGRDNLASISQAESRWVDSKQTHEHLPRTSPPELQRTARPQAFQRFGDPQTLLYSNGSGSSVIR